MFYTTHGTRARTDHLVIHTAGAMADETQRNRDARGRQQTIVRPIDTEGHFAHGHRWSAQARVLLVARLICHLTAAECLAVAQGGDLPARNPAEMSVIYDQLHCDIAALLTAEDKRLGTDVPMPSRDAVIKAARTWTKTFLQQGSVHDAPPHVAGYHVRRNIEALSQVKHMLMAGYRRNGQLYLYRTLQDLRNRKGEQFERWFQKTKLTTLPALWSQLTTAFPTLTTQKLRVKKVRDAAVVQVRAASAA